jgi:hypothetical protein
VRADLLCPGLAYVEPGADGSDGRDIAGGQIAGELLHGPGVQRVDTRYGNGFTWHACGGGRLRAADDHHQQFVLWG